MAKDEQSGAPGRGASFFIQTTEDVAKAVSAAASATTSARSPRPSVVFSLNDDHGGSQFQKLQHQVSKLLKGFSSPPEVKRGTYNPEILTSQKRQWASFQLQYLDHRPLKDPTRLFESMVVVGLHPDCDIQALQRQYIGRKSEGSGRLRNALSYQNQSRVEPNLEPQILFVYPPEKQLPLKHKDLLSFCFPGGLEVNAVERTPSMSELNEILLGQEHLKQSDLSFVFRLQVADDSTLYGCCVLVEEVVQKPSGLLSMILDRRSPKSSFSRSMLTTRRCYCIISRLPFFELHFGLLNSILTEERLNRLKKGLWDLDLESTEGYIEEETYVENSTDSSLNHGDGEEVSNKAVVNVGHQFHESDFHLSNIKEDFDIIAHVDPASDVGVAKREYGLMNLEDVDVLKINKPSKERVVPSVVLPLLRYYQYESSDSSYSFQGSLSEDRNIRSDNDDVETEESSFSGQEESDRIDILEWAKVNNHGTLELLCEYYRLCCPARGSTLKFHPLEHLHPLVYHRPDETALHSAGSTIDLRSCSSSLEYAEAHNALSAEEESTALSAWAIACLCGSLRLEHVLTLFAGALLEKQIVIVCTNLGILSASVLSVIPLLRPYQWQSLLMPVLPDDMLDFLDAPVPYIVGVKNKTSEVQSKLTNAVVIDANKNQVKSPTLPQLPKQRELFSSLTPYHAKLVGESYLGRKRPVYECTDVQTEAAKGFLMVLRSYLNSLCSNLRSNTITNVQSNDDKVSLLLKESFIDSYPSREQSFMKLFVDTQLFSVHTDLVLSFYQKE